MRWWATICVISAMISAGCGGGNPSSPSTQTSTQAPTVTSITPAFGPIAGGTTVTLTGTNFLSSTVVTVTIGGVTATNVQVVSSTSITATTGAHPAGAAAVSVACGGSTGTLPSGFTYSALTVTAIVPTFGPATGGTAITITGTDFADGAQVSIGGVPAASVRVLSSTQITATTAAGLEGKSPVVVSVGNLSASLANGFTYNRPLVLTTYYGGGEPDWSMFSGAKVPNGGAASDPFGQKGLVWALNPMGQWNGGWYPFNLELSSPLAVPFDQFQSWSTDVLLTGTSPSACSTMRFMLDVHFGGTGTHAGSMTAGVLLENNPDGTFWAKGGWSSTAVQYSETATGPQLSFSRWYNLRMDIRVVSPTRVELEYFLNGVSFGVQVPPDWYAMDAVNYAAPWRDIVFWGCDNTAYLANMRAAR